MGLFDALFGRTRLQKPDMDRLFALATAAPTLEEVADLAPGGAAGVCLQPVEGAEFSHLETEVRDLVDLACRDRDFHTQAEVRRDNLGFTWAVFHDPDLAECVTLAHLVGTTLQEKAFGEQLLAAVFRLVRSRGAAAPAQPVYLIYNYKRGRFYPFVPTAGAGERVRDNPAEFQMSAALGSLLPMEKDITRWFALWECPV